VEAVAGRTAYVLNVKPKGKEKYLFQGLIWVDAEDYALVRAEGSPAKNPSFWTKSTHSSSSIRKLGHCGSPSRRKASPKRESSAPPT